MMKGPHVERYACSRFEPVFCWVRVSAAPMEQEHPDGYNATWAARGRLQQSLATASGEAAPDIESSG